VLVPGGTLITATPDEGRALAFTLARHSIHNIQPDLDALKAGRPVYAVAPDSLIAASQVVAIEFQTIAAANNYWRP
jgi:Hexameric tyrosine-coordinated heme protein (HTHP)